MARHLLSDTFSLPAFRPYVRVRQHKRRAILLSVRVGRLLAGEPLQYVLGKVYFMGHSLVIGEGALIPRPETEELCQKVLKKMGREEDAGIGFGYGKRMYCFVFGAQGMQKLRALIFRLWRWAMRVAIAEGAVCRQGRCAFFNETSSQTPYPKPAKEKGMIYWSAIRPMCIPRRFYPKM